MCILLVYLSLSGVLGNESSTDLFVSLVGLADRVNSYM